MKNKCSNCDHFSAMEDWPGSGQCLLLSDHDPNDDDRVPAGAEGMFICKESFSCSQHSRNQQTNAEEPAGPQPQAETLQAETGAATSGRRRPGDYL